MRDYGALRTWLHLKEDERPVRTRKGLPCTVIHVYLMASDTTIYSANCYLLAQQCSGILARTA